MSLVRILDQGKYWRLCTIYYKIAQWCYFGDDNDDQEQEEDDEPVNAPSTNTMLHDKDIDPTNTTLTFAPGEGKRPIFHEPLAEYLCFSTIFCG